MYIIVWGLFFLTSVYGHVGLKIVAENLQGGMTLSGLFTGLRSFYENHWYGVTPGPSTEQIIAQPSFHHNS